METDGEIEDVCVLPGDKESRAFYRVKRNINGADVRYHEQLARFDQCLGTAQSMNLDSFTAGTGPVSTITGADHLEGETVQVWADGMDKGSFVVSGGNIALGETVNAYVYGLPYDAYFKSAKLVGQTGLGVSLTQRSRVNKIGLILADTHAQGLLFGPDYDTLDDMPMVEDGADVDQDTVWGEYDQDMIEFPGDWDTDNRLCLVAHSPRPCTVLAAVINVDRHDNE